MQYNSQSNLALIVVLCLSTLACGAHLSLEIQSSCWEREALDDIVREYLVPKLQDTDNGSGNPNPGLARGGNGDGKQILKYEYSIRNVYGYSISPGGDRRKLETEGPYTSLRGLPKMDCPVVKECPCNGCPGHWCLVFCGYEYGKRSRTLEDTIQSIGGGVAGASAGSLQVQEDSQETVAPSVPGPSSLEGSQEGGLNETPVACGVMDSLLSSPKLRGTCLGDTIVISCTLS